MNKHKSDPADKTRNLIGKILDVVSSKDSIYVIDVTNTERVKYTSWKPGEKLAVAKVAPVSIKSENESKGNATKISANPFIESYYPTLERISSGEVTDREWNKTSAFLRFHKNEASAIPAADLSNFLNKPDIFGKKKKNGKENQELQLKNVSENKKNLQRQLIDAFLQNNDVELESAKTAEDQLHLHQHEHYHYYLYPKDKQLGHEPKGSDPKRTNSNEFKNDAEPAATDNDAIESKKGPITFQSVKVQTGDDTRRKSSKERKARKHEGAERALSEKGGRSRNSFNYNAVLGHPSMNNNFSSTTYIKYSKDEVNKSENSSRHRKNESFLSASRPKPSCSIDSILNKRSDLIITHNYSDSELSKYDSEDPSCSEKTSIRPDRKNIDFTVIRPKDYIKNLQKKHSKSDYSKIIENLQKMDDLLTPKVISNSKRPSKISYIKCERSNSADTKSGDRKKLGKEKNSAHSKEEKNKGTGKECKALNLQNESGTSRSSARKNYKQTETESWTDRLKYELREIKRELRILEDRHLRLRRKSLTMAAVPQLHDRGISVYSSNTYILGSGSFPLPQEPPRVNDESFYKNKEFLYAKMEVSHHFLSNSKYSSRTEEKPISEKGTVMVAERLVSSHQEIRCRKTC